MMPIDAAMRMLHGNSTINDDECDVVGAVVAAASHDSAHTPVEGHRYASTDEYRNDEAANNTRTHEGGNLGASGVIFYPPMMCEVTFPAKMADDEFPS